MTKRNFGMLIDLARCIGCNACAVACKMENDVPLTKFNTWVESWDAGEDGDVRRVNVPKQCNHCTDALCAMACPTGATFVTDEGVVLINKDDCDNCHACMEACPYDVRYEVEAADGEAAHVAKCTYCYHRTSRGMLPACVGTCVAKARLFGDLDDPESDIAKRVAEVEAEALRADFGIDVSTRYVLLSMAEELPVRSAVHRGGVPIASLGKE